MKSPSSRTPAARGPRTLQANAVLCALLFLAAMPMTHVSPMAALWATPVILLAAMLIAWAAESAQFFVAQGFALAILAWLQTLPEFAVEFVYAWNQQVPLLLANLTGALRLLTGLGWPMIYFVAAYFYRRKYGKPLREIRLEDDHCVEVVGLLVPLAYIVIVWAKGFAEPDRRRDPDSDLRRLSAGSAQDAAPGGRARRGTGTHPAHHREIPRTHPEPADHWLLHRRRAVDLRGSRAIFARPAGGFPGPGRARRSSSSSGWLRSFPSSPRKCRLSTGRGPCIAPPWP